MKYKRIPQPKDSYNENPCYDCIFGKDGECNAPEEIINNDEDCGYNFHGQNYIYINSED